MSNFEETLNKPVFKALSPERREMFYELMKRLEGRSSVEAFGILTDFMKRMPKETTPSADEQKAMLETVLSSMPETERERFGSILKMMSQQKSNH